MTFLRNVLTDLVDKKLWPVAVALLVALVAVPVVVGGGESVAPAVPAAPVSEEAQEAVSVTPADAPRGPGDDRRPNDPFRSRPGDATPDAGAQTATGVAPGSGQAAAQVVPGGAAAGGGVAGASTSVDTSASLDIPGLDAIDVVPVEGTDTDTSTSKPGSDDGDAADDAGSWHVDLRFGPSDKATSHENLARLSPLPSADKPYVVFLGVAADGRTGLFLVTSDAQAAGDGKCVRGATACDLVQLRAGQVETFQVTTVDGKHETYHLELQELVRKNADDPAAAKTARLRESDAGRIVLRQAVETKQVDVSGLAYSTALGLVVPRAGTAAAATDRALFGGYRVDLRFGAPGELVKRYNLARLTPLPSVEVPAFVYLGVLGDGETAIFLNPSEAHASGGQAVCEPTPEQCQRVKLGKGQSATFDAPTLDGGTTRYQLDIDGITPLEAETPEAAAASRERESPAGRVILRRLVHEVGGLVEDLTFSGRTGTLQERPPTAE